MVGSNSGGKVLLDFLTRIDGGCCPNKEEQVQETIVGDIPIKDCSKFLSKVPRQKRRLNSSLNSAPVEAYNYSMYSSAAKRPAKRRCKATS